jgi:hypothetical protein
MPERGYASVIIESGSGQSHVLLSWDGDHIVTRYVTAKDGASFEIMLAADSPDWERAVKRARTGSAFL